MGGISAGIGQFGNGVTGFLKAPFTSAGKAVQGDFNGAMNEYSNGLQAPIKGGAGFVQDAISGAPSDGSGGGGGPGGPGGMLLPTTMEQANQQYGNIQNAQMQQQQFLQALQAQNGLANQNTAFQNAQNMANGTGPNPAQAQLAQATGANVANQAAMAAGQRGAGANAGLMARQAANQGANIQQNAAGQAATLQAQQQLAGQQQMANIAGQQATQYGQGMQGQNQLALGAQQNVLGGIGGQNNAIAGMTNAGTAADAERYKADQDRNKGLLGGGAGGLATSLMAMFAQGGQVPEIGNHGPRSQSAQFLSQAKQLKTGGAVPGHAAAPGNSYKNDTVKAMLSPGEVVIPRSVMQSKDPAEAAKAFVAAVLAKQGSRK